MKRSATDGLTHVTATGGKRGAHRLRLVLGVLAALALFAMPASSGAETLYGATSFDPNDEVIPPGGELYTVDSATGATTLIGPIGFRVTALGFDPTTNIFYGVTEDEDQDLLTINTATGAGTSIGSLGNLEIEDITFDATGQLFGWSDAEDALVRIDKFTAETEIVVEGGERFGLFGSISVEQSEQFIHGLLYDFDIGANALFAIDSVTEEITLRSELTYEETDIENDEAFFMASSLACDGISLTAILWDIDREEVPNGPTPSEGHLLMSVDSTTGFADTRGVTRDNLDALAWDCTPTPPAPPPPPDSPAPPAPPQIAPPQTRTAPSAVTQPRISIGDRTVIEGNQASVPVRLSRASNRTVRVSYATEDLSAIGVQSRRTRSNSSEARISQADGRRDYRAKRGTVTFRPGSTRARITVQTLDDRPFERPERLNVRLRNPNGATISDGRGIVRILDNDRRPRFTG